jgi:hypothetical protein
MKNLANNAIKNKTFSFTEGRNVTNVNFGCGNWSFVKDGHTVTVSVQYRVSGGVIRNATVGSFKI